LLRCRRRVCRQSSWRQPFLPLGQPRQFAAARTSPPDPTAVSSSRRALMPPACVRLGLSSAWGAGWSPATIWAFSRQFTAVWMAGRREAAGCGRDSPAAAARCGAAHVRQLPVLADPASMCGRGEVALSGPQAMRASLPGAVAGLCHHGTSKPVDRWHRLRPQVRLGELQCLARTALPESSLPLRMALPFAGLHPRPGNGTRPTTGRAEWQKSSGSSWAVVMQHAGWLGTGGRCAEMVGARGHMSQRWVRQSGCAIWNMPFNHWHRLRPTMRFGELPSETQCHSEAWPRLRHTSNQQSVAQDTGWLARHGMRPTTATQRACSGNRAHAAFERW